MKFTKITTAAALCVGLALPATAEEATLTAVHSLPATNDLTKSYFAFVDDLPMAKASFRLNCAAAPKPFLTNEQLNSVSCGIVDLYFGPAGYFQRQIPELTPIDTASVPADKLRAVGLHTPSMRHRANARASPCWASWAPVMPSSST